MPAATGTAAAPIWGFYSNGDQPILDADALVASTGKRTSVRGIYRMPSDDFWLEDAWTHGWTPWVQLWPSQSVDVIANSSSLDGEIRAWAVTFVEWAVKGRRAYIVPMAEGNGPWVPYYGTGQNYQAAFRKIRQIFESEMDSRGVPRASAIWVFSPNGGGVPVGSEFENYYPGSDVVDQVSVSAYNFGGCTAAPGWDTFDNAIKPYLDRLNQMTGGTKPMWLDTGTVDKGGDKDAWLRDTFGKFAAYLNARGIIYFNYLDTSQVATLPNCPNGVDYRVYVPGTDKWQGFKDAIAGNLYSYEPPLPPTPPSPTVTLTQGTSFTISDGTTGQPFTVSWSSTNATSCTVQKTAPGGVELQSSWATGTSGSKVAGPYKLGTHHWWIDCAGAGGTAHQDMYHTVISGIPF